MTDAQDSVAQAETVEAIVAAAPVPAVEARRTRATAKQARAEAKAAAKAAKEKERAEARAERAAAKKSQTDAVVARRLAGEPAPDPEPDDAAELAAQAERDAAAAEVDVALSAQEAEREAAEVAAVPATRADRRKDRRAKEPAPDDDIVEAPPSLGRPSRTTRERLAVVAIVVGALALLCSVVLAIGALIAALEVGSGSSLASAITNTSDVLVGPLDGLFTFSGDNAQSKADLVTRGIASMVYLAIGLTAPSLLRRAED